jgi:glycosyltransferase involved in cell wall biosynthesis
VHFLGKVPYNQHLALLKRSDAHVYLSYPFVASWSLREALACGCAVVGGDSPTVSEFIQHGKNGLLVPFLDSAALADSVLRVLGDAKLGARLRAGARAYAEQHLDLQAYITRYRDLIEQVAGKALLISSVPSEAEKIKAKARKAA